MSTLICCIQITCFNQEHVKINDLDLQHEIVIKIYRIYHLYLWVDVLQLFGFDW